MDPVLNFAKATVSTLYDAAATSVVLTGGDGAKFPQPSSDGSFNLVWWNSSDYNDPGDDPNVEVVRCTALVTDTLTIARAQEGTSATTKNTAGKTYKMILAFTAKTYEDLVGYDKYYSVKLTPASTFSEEVEMGFTGAITPTVSGAEVTLTSADSEFTEDFWLDDNKKGAAVGVITTSTYKILLPPNWATIWNYVIIKVYLL